MSTLARLFLLTTNCNGIQGGLDKFKQRRPSGAVSTEGTAMRCVSGTLLTIGAIAGSDSNAPGT